jgi:glycosyltransferase involved in cell wall biosynthesis
MPPLVLDVSVNEPVQPPTASVVISTRNHARYLGATLAAVEAQSLEDLELVVVDNASTDETEAVMRAFLARTIRPVTYLRFDVDHGPAIGRSTAVDRVRGDFVAFTDSDCVPSEHWLKAALDSFSSAEIGIVQGRTEGLATEAPLFSHFIETRRFDSSFSTSNVVYRRAALNGHRFDRRCAYWEDTDLGFRVRGDGWRAAFSDGALVYHQVVPQSPARWLLWPQRYANWPAKAARYPEFRRTLFLGVWVNPLHACFDLALVGLVFAAFGRRRVAAALTIPYLVAFARTRGLRGRAPVMKAALYLLRDGVAFSSLVSGSVRNRTVVL